MKEKLESKLVTRVIELLRNRPYTLFVKIIAEDTGVPEPWIKALYQGRIKEPSCVRIEILYEYLSGNTLEVL